MAGPRGGVNIELLVPESLASDSSLAIRDFTINRIAYPDLTHNLEGTAAIEFSYADLLGDFIAIVETLDEDSSGFNTFYSHINDVLTLPEAKVGVLESGSVTQGYLHVDEGERFAFDHDTFVMSAGESGDYRLKFTPDDPSLFTSNVISHIFKADGSRGDLVMNLVSRPDAYHDGSLYSSAFSLVEEEDHFLTLSMRGDWDSANGGPAPYQIELVEAMGVTESELIF